MPSKSAKVLSNKLVIAEIVSMVLMVIFLTLGGITGFSGWRDLAMIDLGVMATTGIQMYFIWMRWDNKG